MTLAAGLWDTIAGPLIVTITGVVVSSLIAFFVARATAKREMKGLFEAERVHGVYPEILADLDNLRRILERFPFPSVRFSKIRQGKFAHRTGTADFAWWEQMKAQGYDQSLEDSIHSSLTDLEATARAYEKARSEAVRAISQELIELAGEVPSERELAIYAIMRGDVTAGNLGGVTPEVFRRAKEHLGNAPETEHARRLRWTFEEQVNSAIALVRQSRERVIKEASR